MYIFKCKNPHQFLDPTSKTRSFPMRRKHILTILYDQPQPQHD